MFEVNGKVKGRTWDVLEDLPGQLIVKVTEMKYRISHNP
jgi:hypothetical protein